MPRTYSELTSELASLRSDWLELDRACGELPEELPVLGLLHLAMARLDDRIKVVERNLALADAVTLADADQSPRLGAAA